MLLEAASKREELIAKKIQENGGVDPRLPAVAPPPSPSARLGLRIPTKAAGVSSLKIPRR